MKKDKLLKLSFEFTRYLIVGGIAFTADFGVLFLLKSYILHFSNSVNTSVAAVIGFIVGLIVNYVLSLKIVFIDNKGKGRDCKSFVTFAVIGVIGLVLTERGLYLGESVLHIDYRIVKIFMTSVVLVWNYVARKIFIFNRKDVDCI